jgi:hypothetical protein
VPGQSSSDPDGLLRTDQPGATIFAISGMSTIKPIVPATTPKTEALGSITY